MLFNITWKNPSQISSQGVNRDRFNIFFEKIDSLIKCTPALRRRQLQTAELTDESVEVPASMGIQVEIPPQI